MCEIIAFPGLLEVSRKKDIVYIDYAGNMGASLDDVREVFDAEFGIGSFDRVVAKSYSFKGSPDYMWTAKIRDWNFIEATGVELD